MDIIVTPNQQHNNDKVHCVQMTDNIVLFMSSQTTSLAWTPNTLKKSVFLGRESLQIIQTYPLPDLRKGCLPRNFTKVEFYIKSEFL